LAESPLTKLARLLGGVVLMQGGLGHQVLGQMLVMGSKEVAVAGAAVVVAATTRQRNAVAQVALRTAAPALAAHVLLQKEEKRIERKETLMAERECKVEERERKVEERERAAVQAADARFVEAAAKITALEAPATLPDIPAAVPRAASRPRVKPAANKAVASGQRKGKKRSGPTSKS